LVWKVGFMIPMVAPNVAAVSDPYAKLAEQASSIIKDAFQQYQDSKKTKEHVDNIYAGVQKLSQNPAVMGLDDESAKIAVNTLKPTDDDRSHPDWYEKRVADTLSALHSYASSKQNTQGAMAASSPFVSPKGPAPAVPPQSGSNLSSIPAGGQPMGGGQPQQPSPAPDQMGPPAPSQAGPDLSSFKQPPSHFASLPTGGNPPDQKLFENTVLGKGTTAGALPAGLSALNTPPSAMQNVPTNGTPPAAPKPPVTPPAPQPPVVTTPPQSSVPAPSAAATNDPEWITSLHDDDKPAARILQKQLEAARSNPTPGGKNITEAKDAITEFIKTDVSHKQSLTKQKEMMDFEKGQSQFTQTSENVREKSKEENALKIEKMKLANQGGAGGYGGKMGMMGTLPDGAQQLVKRQAKLIAEGHASPEMTELTARSGMANLRPYVEQELADNYPEFNISQASGDRKYWNSQQTRKQLQVMNVVSEQLPKLREASTEMKRLGIPVLDKKGIEALSATGNVDAANYIAASTATVEDIGKAIAGGNAITDDQLRLAQRIIPPGASPEQLDKVAQQIQGAVNSRKLTVYAQGGVYGKVAAKNDPWLDDDTRSKIIGTTPITQRQPGSTATSAITKSKWIPGQVYTDAKGNKAKYNSDGTWTEVQ
jgi:hypothetical protein